MGGMLTMDPGEGGELPGRAESALQAMTGGMGGWPAWATWAAWAPMMRRIGGMMVGGQTGAAVGALAREVVSSTDVGLPLGPEGVAALLPSGVAEFSEGLSVGADEVRHLPGAARDRPPPAVRPRAVAAGAAARRGRGLRPGHHGGHLGAARRHAADRPVQPGGAARRAGRAPRCSSPRTRPQQKAALSRLEILLALVEGWVATVVAPRPADRLPQAAALAEAIRRRRATGGPAEQTFATLVGLELRPRRLREAAALWQQLTEARGVGGPGRGVVASRPAAHGRGLGRPGGVRRRTAGTRHVQPGSRRSRRPRRMRMRPSQAMRPNLMMRPSRARAARGRQPRPGRRRPRPGRQQPGRRWLTRRGPGHAIPATHGGPPGTPGDRCGARHPRRAGRGACQSPVGRAAGKCLLSTACAWSISR